MLLLLLLLLLLPLLQLLLLLLLPHSRRYVHMASILRVLHCCLLLCMLLLHLRLFMLLVLLHFTYLFRSRVMLSSGLTEDLVSRETLSGSRAAGAGT